MKNNNDFLEDNLWNNNNTLSFRNFLNSNPSFLLKLYSISLNTIKVYRKDNINYDKFVDGYLQCIEDIKNLSYITDLSNNKDDSVIFNQSDTLSNVLDDLLND